MHNNHKSLLMNSLSGEKNCSLTTPLALTISRILNPEFWLKKKKKEREKKRTEYQSTRCVCVSVIIREGGNEISLFPTFWGGKRQHVRIRNALALVVVRQAMLFSNLRKRHWLTRGLPCLGMKRQGVDDGRKTEGRVTFRRFESRGRANDGLTRDRAWSKEEKDKRETTKTSNSHHIPHIRCNDFNDVNPRLAIRF